MGTQRWASLVDALPLFLATCSVDGTLVAASGHWRELGADPQRIPGSNLADLVVPADRDLAARELALALERERVVALRLDAESGPVWVEATLVAGGAGEVHFCARDIRRQVRPVPEDVRGLHRLLASVPAVGWATDAHLNVTDVWGVDLDGMPGSIEDLARRFDVGDQVRAAMRDVLRGGDTAFEFSIGERRFQGHMQAVFDDERGLLGTIGIGIDNTRHRRVEDQLRRQTELLGGIAEMATHLLKNPEIDDAINAALATVGALSGVDRVYVFEQHVGPDGSDVFSQRYEWCRAGVVPHADDPALQNVELAASGYGALGVKPGRGKAVSANVSELRGEARARLEAQGIVSLMVVPLLLGEELWGFVGFDDCRSERDWTYGEALLLQTVAADVGAAVSRKRSEAKIRHQAYHDHLTGLPNRVLFRDRLTQAVAQARHSGDLVGVLTCDIDRFQLVNETHGHEVGDRLLGDIGDRLRTCVGADDTVARLGGDEFGILLPGLDSVDDAVRIAQQVLTMFSRPFEVYGDRHYCSLSIGAALFPFDGDDADMLIRNAASASFRAKNQGGATHQLYSPEMNAAAFERLLLENNLRSALHNRELTMFYQPVVDLRSGRIDGVEALVRWRHPEMGLVLPAAFVPLAEDTGLIESVGDVALRTACAQLAAWEGDGFGDLRVAVNLSPHQIRQPDLVAAVQEILDETGCAADRIELELTESVIADKAAVPVLLAFKDRGLRIVVDDFGVGYSALSYLRRLPVDGLKVDRSFVADILEDPTTAVIARAIVDLAHTLGMEVTAEGVETEAQLSLLAEWGCDRAQGFLFSGPQEAPDAARLIAGDGFGVPETV